jgi:mono/diheme cytochrome c family protein
MFPTRSRLALAAACLALAGATRAEERGEGEGRAPLLPKYQQECSACHMAYPPRMLPAASWQRLMAHLPQHFGTDASMDPRTVAELTTWLTANAGSSVAPPQDRITTSRWFTHEHDEVPRATWQRPAIKSASNCAACHAQAEQGVFDEHDVRIPR